MDARRYCIGALILLAILAPGWQAPRAQTLMNPDISLIGDMRYVYRDNVAKQLADSDNISFEFEEMEINFTGYINPYVRADAYLAIHGVEGPFEIEEINATVVRGIPVQARFGKYFLDMGRLNTEHPHQWAWMERPLMLQSFFGAEGAQAVGLNLNRLQGVGDTAVTISFNVMRGDVIGGHVHEGDTTSVDEDVHAHGGDGPAKVGYSGRLSAFREINDTNFLAFGGSYLYTQPDFDHDLTAQVAGLDITYKWFPDIYKGVKLRAEAMMSSREVEDEVTESVETVDAYGAFAAAEIKFRRRFDFGGYYDWSEDAVHEGIQTRATGAFVAFMPAEETARFSLVYRYEESDLYQGSSNSLTFQVLFALGPHKPHQF